MTLGLRRSSARRSRSVIPPPHAELDPVVEGFGQACGADGARDAALPNELQPRQEQPIVRTRRHGARPRRSWRTASRGPTTRADS